MWAVCHWDANHGLVEDATAHDKNLAQACRDDYVKCGLIPGSAFIAPKAAPSPTRKGVPSWLASR